MKKLLLSALLSIPSCTPAVADSIYLKVGAGYKFDELALYSSKTREMISDPLTARIEVGYEKGPLTFGVSHHSQWLRGWPVDDKLEYYKTELFVDYKIDWEL